MQLISGRLALAQHAFRPAVLHTARRALQASPVMARQGERDEDKAARKAAKKAVKSAVQAKRRGEIPGQGSKKCDRCAQSKDLLIRCGDSPWPHMCPRAVWDRFGANVLAASRRSHRAGGH